MNTTKEIGKTMSNLSESMRGQPACVAAILMAALFAILTYLSLSGERAEMHIRQLALIERCTFPPPHVVPPFSRP